MIVSWLARGVDQLPTGDGWLSDAERARAASMRSTKRRSEFLVSRYAAKHAIAGAADRAVDGPETLALVEVRHRPSGAPSAFVAGAPAGLSMSLTDRADWAVCVVSRAGEVAVGCDLELVEPRSPSFVRDYLTSAEQDAVAAASDPHLVANLLWSAKESALKVLETGLRRDTRTVAVTLGGAPEAGWWPFSVRPVEGGTFPGWWRRWGAFVLTVAADRPHGPPRALEDPSGLESAIPSHRWLDRPRA
jgi:4'-phosphopantetheinyl transferase